MSNSIDWRIYVASLSDYNNDTLHGVWIDFDACSDVDEVQDAINTMLLASPYAASEFAKQHGLQAEEWAIHDYEGWAGITLSESEGIGNLWETYKHLQDLEDCETEAFSIYYTNLLNASETDWDTLDNFRAAYQGEFDSDADFAEYLLEETGGLDAIPENLRYYFDYEKYARDLFIGGDYWTHEGYVFSNY